MNAADTYCQESLPPTQMSANINMDRQTPMPEWEPDYPLATTQRRPASWSQHTIIPQYSLSTFPSSPQPPPEVEMPGPIRTAQTRTSGQPPRPPNAWILYRSDRVREMPPLAPGENRTQAQVSKKVSERWRNESEATRAEYERRAEAKKAEHSLKYPHYRFQPKKKEEKERERAEKKLEKERLKQNRGRVVAPSPPANIPPLPYPIASVPQADVRYGLAGPSPPLSAASSPTTASSNGESQQADEHPYAQPSHASPSPRSLSGTSDSTASTVQSPVYTGTAVASQSQYLPSSALTHVWQSQQQLDPTPPQGMANSMHMWQSYDPPQQPPAADSAPSPDYVSFDLGIQTLQSWMNSGGTVGFDETIQALLSATGDPSIFQLNQFDANALTSNPAGEIEVSVGEQMPYTGGVSFMPDFTTFEYGDIPGAASQATLSDGRAATRQAADLASHFSFDPGDPSSGDFGGYNADDFINYDASPTTSTPEPTPTTHMLPPVAIGASAIRQPAPYVPPAGAAYSSTRRVAASWKPSFTTADSPVDTSPPRPWGVPAT